MLTSDFVRGLATRALPLALLGVVASACFSDAGGSSTSETGTSEGDASAGASSEGEASAGGTQVSASASSTGSTGSDSTTGSMGSTGLDSSTTAAPGDCSGSCVEAPPDGWLGPVAAREGDVDASIPGCQGGFPDMVWSLYGDLAADGACACSCEFYSQGCGPTTASFFEDGCGGLPDLAVMLHNSECEVWFGPSVGGWSVEPAPHLGTCAAEATPALAEPAFATQWRACGGAMFSEGCEGGLCAPALPDGYDRLCVYREGEHTCPPGAYSVAETRYSSLEDTRSCDEADCACGPVEGDCDTALKLSSQNCEIPKKTVSQECTIASQIGSYHLEAEPSPETSCPPVADELAPDGDVQGLGPVTFCCTG